MNESNEQPSSNEDAGAGGSPEGRPARPATPWGDSDEAFGARQADGLCLSCLYIEADDGRFVSALEYLMDSKAAEADAEE
jgi:hypothetical protein